MPYIDNNHLRRMFLVDGEHDAIDAGELTYQIQQLIVGYLAVPGLHYQQIAEVLGSLEGAKLDFIERIVKPYEASKRVENGDVWPESLLAKAAYMHDLLALDPVETLPSAAELDRHDPERC